MSVIGDAITTWKHGFTITMFLLLFGILAPLATATMISIIIILPMFVFGFDLTFWDEKSNEIVYLSILIFGPYFIGKEWNQIQNIVSKIFKN